MYCRTKHYQLTGMRKTVALMLVALIAFLFGGCAGAAGAGEQADWSRWQEPGWMAQMRQYKEQHFLAMTECLDEFGVRGVPVIGTGNVAVGHSDPAINQHHGVALRECVERIGEAGWVYSMHRIDAESYLRMLDTRQCLIHLGYEIPDPPSVDVWIQNRGFWTPHRYVFSSMSLDHFAHLVELCPQTPGSMLLSVIDTRIE